MKVYRFARDYPFIRYATCGELSNALKEANGNTHIFPFKASYFVDPQDRDGEPISIWSSWDWIQDQHPRRTLQLFGSPEMRPEWIQGK